MSSVVEARKVCKIYHNAFNDQDLGTIHTVMLASDAARALHGTSIDVTGIN